MTPMTSKSGSAARIFKSAEIVAMPARGPVYDCDASLLSFFDATGGRDRKLKTGECLFLQGDDVHAIYLLRTGWAFRYQCLEDGRRQIIDFILPGDVVGIESSGSVFYAVEALSPCSWAASSRATLFAQLWCQPALGTRLVGVLAAGQRRAFDQMTSIGRRTARERVAHLLFTLAQRVQESMSGPASIEITMPVMLSHIADALGLAAETVCRCLAELKRAGILAFGAGRLAILDLDGLARIVGARADDDTHAASLGRGRAKVA